jgi:hypothetical protein
MNSNLRTDLLGSSQNLTNVVATDADIEAPTIAQQFNFNDIHTLIEDNSALAAQGHSLIQPIQDIETSTQELINLGAIGQEKFAQLKRDLSTLLTRIAPSIAPYTGTGLLKVGFTINSSAFLNHFSDELQAGSSSSIPPLLLLTGLPLVLAGGLTAVIGNRNGKSTEQRTITSAVGLTVMAIGLILTLMPICIISYRARNQIEISIKTARTNIGTAVNNIYSTLCTPRRALDYFEINLGTQPNYFKELAAKLFATRLVVDRHRGFDRDDEKAINVLRVFSQTNTPEGHKFNAILREDTYDNMLACIHQLLAITIIQTGDHQLTLQANHILGADAAQYLYGLIDLLRNEASLEPWQWPATELTNGVAVEEIRSKKEAMLETVNAVLAKYTPITLPASSLSNLTGPAQNPLLTINSAAAADVNDDEQAPVPTQATRILPLNITTSDTPVTIHAKTLSASTTASNTGIPLAQATQMQPAFFTESKTSDTSPVAALTQNSGEEMKAAEKEGTDASPKQ